MCGGGGGNERVVCVNYFLFIWILNWIFAKFFINWIAVLKSQICPSSVSLTLTFVNLKDLFASKRTTCP